MRGQAFIAASALAAALMAGAQPAAAQQQPQYNTYQDANSAYEQCRVQQRDRTVGGAIIGGIAGAILGHNVAGGHGSRDEGTALGAVVGGVAGGAIGHSSTNGQCQPPQANAYDPYYGQAQTPNDQYAQGDQYYGSDQYGQGDGGEPYDDPYAKQGGDQSGYYGK